MIAVTGVTGKLGGRVAKVLSERGIDTVHIARNPMNSKIIKKMQHLIYHEITIKQKNI